MIFDNKKAKGRETDGTYYNKYTDIRNKPLRAYKKRCGKDLKKQVREHKQKRCRSDSEKYFFLRSHKCLL